MAVVGSILGDIAGSQYEEYRPDDLDWRSCKLFTDKCQFTDDTVMTLAIKKAIVSRKDFSSTMQSIGRDYPYCGWGKTFFYWIFCKDPIPYNSYGNGSAMRVSFIGEYYDDIRTVQNIARKSAVISHSHYEGIKGAVITASCVWMAKHGRTKDDIMRYVIIQYPPDKYEFSGRDMDYLRNNYSWDVTCMTSVPVAMACFYYSNSYESFLRNVFSLRCDMDTLCAIGGGVAEEYYGTTGFNNRKLLKKYLDERLFGIVYG